MHCFHNDIMGGWQSGLDNINVEPGFLAGSYSLCDTSACIGAGVDSVEIDSVSGWYHAPQFDFDGSLRPNPAGSRPDIGAWEHPLEIGINQSALLPDPISIDFRNVHPGLSGDTLTVALFNRTTIDREILSISLSNGEYRLAPAPPLPLRIPAYKSIGVGVLFAPITPGSVVHDTLLITTADLVKPNLNIPLTGRGSAPARCAGAGTLYGVSITPDRAGALHAQQEDGKCPIHRTLLTVSILRALRFHGASPRHHTLWGVHFAGRYGSLPIQFLIR